MTDLVKPQQLFQYKNSTKFNSLVDGLFTLFEDVSFDNLYSFLDIDSASGLWLDQIGLYLNYQRPIIYNIKKITANNKYIDIKTQIPPNPPNYNVAIVDEGFYIVGNNESESGTLCEAIHKALGLSSDIHVYVENNKINIRYDFSVPTLGMSFLFKTGANSINSIGETIGFDDDTSFIGGTTKLYVANNSISQKIIMDDALFKILLKAEIFRRNSHFTINEVISNLKYALGADSVFLAEMAPKLVHIIVITYNNDISALINSLNTLDERWFGLPTGVGLTSFDYVNFTDPAKKIFVYDKADSVYDDPNIVYYK